MSYELIILNKKGLVLSPPVIDGVTIEWQRKSQPGKLTFSCVKSSGLSFDEGDQVRFSVDGVPMFFGFVFEKSRTGLEDKKLNVTCYDQIFYLTKNKDTYVFENKTAADIIRMLAADFHLNLGTLTATPVNFESLVFDNKSLYDMISTALSATMQSTGLLYTLYDNAGRLTLSTTAEMTLPLLISEETAGNFDYKTSIAEDTYNRIKLTYEDKKAGTRQIFFAEDPLKTAQWGVLQYYEKLNDGTMAQKRSTSLLSMYDSKSRTLTLKNVLGDKRIHAGSLVMCKLGLGDINLSNFMMVEQVKHMFRENEHLMDLRFAEYRPLTDVSNAVTGVLTTAIPKEEAAADGDIGEAAPGGGENMRTSRPSDSNKYYVTTGGGGYNRCIPGNSKNGRTSSTSVIPNCVGYAYGRYMEMRGITSCNLPTCDAKNWYSVAKSRGYKCDKTPSVGSVVVFGGTKWGHVAVVEQIKENGDLVLSESNWSHSAFRNVTLYKSNGYNYSSGLKLIGFIH
ncbi:MAG: CHAP domain-containing protein [Clostridia bacterium]|nr:CHAP domain-containing protein [Clostridia bacterium]